MKRTSLGVWDHEKREAFLEQWNIHPNFHGGVWDFRPFINLQCNYRCSLPHSGHLFCHTIEEMPNINSSLIQQNGQREEISKTRLLCKLFSMLKREYGINQIKIAGMEPTLSPDLPMLLRAFFEQKPDRISLTTNGSRLIQQAKDLARTGLKDLTVSLHSLHPEEYRYLTRGGKLSIVIKGIQKALDEGFHIKINHLMLKGSRTPLEQMIDFCSQYELELKLYQLIWDPQIPYTLYKDAYVDPVSQVTSLLESGSNIEVKRFVIPNRDRWRFKTAEGLPFAFDIFGSKTEVPSFLPCRTCHYKFVCQEGYLGYGLEMTPDSIVTTCGLRNDLAVDLRKVLMHEKGIRQLLTIRQYAPVFVHHLSSVSDAKHKEEYKLSSGESFADSDFRLREKHIFEKIKEYS